jgi:iron complex outermembrane receptor protein
MMVRGLGPITALGLFGLTLFLPRMGIAESSVVSEDSLLTYELGEIIVTADGWRDEIHVRVETLRSTELEKHPGHDAAELLASVPGVGVTTGRKDEADITIRGFSSRRVTIMVDGRPMNVPYYGTFNLASVNSDNLEQITVVKGPASVTYGPNVMGGVVNFVTARGRNRPGTRLHLRAGDHDTGDFRMSHGSVRGPWDVLLSVRGGGSGGMTLSREFQPTGYPGAEDGGLRDNSDFREWELFGKIGYRGEEQTDLALSLGYLTREKGLPGAVDEERYWRFTDWRRYFADLTLRRQISPSTFLEAKGYGDVFINTLVDYEDESFDEDAAFYNSTHHNWDAGCILALEKNWSRVLHGTYGINLREDQIKKRMNPDEPWLYHHQVTGSVHTEHRGWLLPTVTGSVGLSDNFMVHNHLKDVDHALGASAGVTWRVHPRWALFASAGRGTRFPTLSQLWSLQSGNQDLRPETTLRTEVGMDARSAGSLQMEGTLFWNDLEDLIDRDLRRAGRYRNISSARTQGVEWSTSTRLWDRFRTRLSYAYTRSENRETGEPLDHVPRHKVDVEFSAVTDGGDTEWFFVVSRVGERFDSESLEADGMLPAYVTADCKVSTKIARRTSLALEVFNIADQDYEEEVGYPAPGRTVLVSGTMSF